MDIPSFCGPLLAGDFAGEMRDAIDMFAVHHDPKGPKALQKFALFFLNGEYLTGEEDEYYETDEEAVKAKQRRQEAREQFASMCNVADMRVERCAYTSVHDDSVHYEYSFMTSDVWWRM